MDLSPSVAALLLPHDQAPAAVAALGRALERRGYASWSGLPPLRDGLLQDAWLGMAVLPPPQPGAATLVILEDVDAVFRVALWYATEHPRDDLAAYRRYMGCDPTLKVYGSGHPLWRDGEDADHELPYPLSEHAPNEALSRLSTALPRTAQEATGEMRSRPRSYKEALARPGVTPVAWARGVEPQG